MAEAGSWTAHLGPGFHPLAIIFLGRWWEEFCRRSPSGQAIVVVVIYQTSMDAFESQQPVHELQLWEPFCILDFWSSSYQGVAYWYLRLLLDVCLLVGMLVSQLAHTCLMFIWTATWLEPSHLSSVSSMPMTFSVDREVCWLHQEPKAILSPGLLWTGLTTCWWLL